MAAVLRFLKKNPLRFEQIIDKPRKVLSSPF